MLNSSLLSYLHSVVFTLRSLSVTPLLHVAIFPSNFIALIPVLLLLIFFFRAEYGIRGYKVTGVQTCALPISRLVHVRSSRSGRGHGVSPVSGASSARRTLRNQASVVETWRRAAASASWGSRARRADRMDRSEGRSVGRGERKREEEGQ